MTTFKSFILKLLQKQKINVSLQYRLTYFYFLRLFRPKIKGLANDQEEVIKTSRKQKKGYCLRPNDWNIAEKASKNEQETAVEKFKK